MDTLYTAYARAINGTTFYFVKSYQTFPEYRNVPPLLRTYGMHTHFECACRIASIFDKETQHELLHTIENDAASASVLPVYPAVAEVYNLRRRYSGFPYLMRLFGIG